MLKRLYRNLRHRQDVERDLSDELRGYIEEMTARKVAEGMDPASARREVLAEMGGVSSLQERVREERVGFQFEATIWKPFLLALRRLWRDPAFTLTAVLTLAFAIGANTAIFSIADHVLFRPLPYEDPDRLHVLMTRARQTGLQYTQVLFEHLQQINDRHSSVSQVGMMSASDSILVTANGVTESVPTLQVTANYFEILGVKAYRGRLFQPADTAEPERNVVMTHSAWLVRFAGDEGVLGKEVRLGSASFRLLGVLPPGFVFPFPTGLLRNAEVIRAEAPPRPGEKGGTFFPIVRLDAGVTREKAQAEIEALIPGPQYPALNDVKERLYPVGRRMLGFLLAASILVLLIGCSNLAIMLLVRGRSGVREAGVRAALGASRVQLVLPVLFEAVTIGVAGALLAVGATVAVFKTLLLQVPPAVYGGASVGVDLRVMLFALGLGLLGGLIFAVVPAWRSAHLDVQGLIQGREALVVRRGRLGAPLVAGQVALAVLLVVGALRVGRAFTDALNVPLGFDPSNVAAVTFVPQAENSAAMQRAYVQVAQALASLRGVESVGASHQIPLDGHGPYSSVQLNGVDLKDVGAVPALPGYFQSLRVPLLRGRLFDWNDVRGGGDAAVLTESAAQRMFPGRDALGETFETIGRRHRVVGIVADTMRTPMIEPAAFVLPQSERAVLTFVIRTRNREEAQLAAIRRDISGLVPGVPITAAWWEDTLDALPRVRDPRFQTLVLGTFGGLALGLTALGIFGVVAFSVAVRTKEMGIRMAVGAEASSLVRMILRQVLGPVTLGLVVGLDVSRWAGRVAEKQAGLIADASWVWPVAAGITVGAAALLAAYLPARRASRVDPMIVLRSE